MRTTMRRVWMWIGFAFLLAIGYTALALVSLNVWRLNRAETEARNRALVEENLRLALWRIDASVSPLIAQESARPVANFTQVSSIDREQGIHARFEWKPDGSHSKTSDPMSLLSSLEATSELDYQRIRLRVVEATKLFASVASTSAALDQTSADEFRNRGQNEFVQRSQNIFAQNSTAMANGTIQSVQLGSAILVNDPSPTPMVSLWESEQMLLVRRISRNGSDFLQGSRLDWDAVCRRSLVLIADLLPHAELIPVADEIGRSGPEMLASLPARLVPGAVEVIESDTRFSVPLMLATAWTGAILAAVAGAVLLAGIVRLSDRRADFVSAVTHELRTPLTTFQLYTELLSQGMVHDEATRRSYLETLHSESLRLNHLVENVLAYARLERGRNTGPAETVQIDKLLERLKPRLTRLAERSDMVLIIEPSHSMKASIRTRTSLIEQILINLVDNSCKYAASASDRRIIVSSEASSGSIDITVQDFGPGFPSGGTWSKAFGKTAQQAAESAPGIGLGLALCRQLARQLNSNLLIQSNPNGARVVLQLHDIVN